jgi:GT2 family glycosyltransferase
MSANVSRPGPGDAGGALVSVLIVNYNGARWLRDCLESLASVTYPTREVVVVDNGSEDDSLEVLRGYPWVRVVKSERNLGFAGGNNLGLRHCQGALVLLLNNDTVVTAGFLEPLVRYLERHPQVGIVQSKMRLSRQEGVLDVCGSFLTACGFLYHFGYWKPDGPLYARSYPIFSAKGACMMLRRELVERVGGVLFEESFFCYYEETDLCHRAWLAGVETHFVAESTIDHLHGATGGEPNRAGFVLRHYLRNQLFSLLGNLSVGGLFRVLPLYGVVFLASLLAALLTLRWPLLAAQGHALGHCWRQRGRVRERRRLVKRIRVLRDRDLFARVMRTPGLTYFWRSFTGTLGRYPDHERVLTQ